MKTELKPRMRVRLKPLEECGQHGLLIDHEMEGFFRLPFVTISRVDEWMGDTVFFIDEDQSGDQWQFDPDWIAEILPAEDIPRIKPQPYYIGIDEGAGESKSVSMHWYNPDTHVAIEKSVWKCNSGPRDGWEIYDPATHRLVPVEHYVGPEEFAEFVFYHFGGAWKRPSDVHPGYGPRMAKLPPSVERIVRRMAGEGYREAKSPHRH